VGDFDGDGKADDLAGLNGAGNVYYTTNLSTWRNIPGTLSKIVVGDFDGDGKADDLAGRVLHHQPEHLAEHPRKAESARRRRRLTR